MAHIIFACLIITFIRNDPMAFHKHTVKKHILNLTFDFRHLKGMVQPKIFYHDVLSNLYDFVYSIFVPNKESQTQLEQLEGK